MRKQRNPQRERGKINTEGSGSVHGVNGLLRYVIHGKVSDFGLERLTLLKKLRELMTEARRIWGKKAKVNFPDEIAPTVVKCTTKTNPRAVFRKENSNSILPSLNQDFNSVIHPDCDYYISLGFVEEKPIPKTYGYEDAYPAIKEVGRKPLASSDSDTLYFNSDQGSNSFDYSDFGWGEHSSKNPEITSVLSATLEGDEAQYRGDVNPAKKLKS